jgi:hypothetical protein
MLPAESTTTYCLPPCSNVLPGAATPASVWNCHNRRPVALSRAV